MLWSNWRCLVGAGISCFTLDAYYDCDYDTAGTAGASGSSSTVGKNDGCTGAVGKQLLAPSEVEPSEEEPSEVPVL